MVYEFHGHKCPFMPLGCRLGVFDLTAMELDRAKDQDFWVISEMGVRHPKTCLIDVLQAATGCTCGKGLRFMCGFRTAGSSVFLARILVRSFIYNY